MTTLTELKAELNRLLCPMCHGNPFLDADPLLIMLPNKTWIPCDVITCNLLYKYHRAQLNGKNPEENGVHTRADLKRIEELTTQIAALAALESLIGGPAVLPP